MTWRDFILGLVRTRIINNVTEAVLTDIDTNGLSAADDAIIDAYLLTTKP
ncbi:hypothetical protein RDp07_gp40 [Roseobacter phage RD-1410Ws-07]|uniref:Uncharacterized protein n=2 Tax=Sanyabayvirus DS1410Ws06 TaxID=2844087 RepID=A0A191VYR6_9CAUD|nr:hypothetical protein HYO98_gp43 [Dinoroseobacter phage DS-1410Ws-06]ANJ20700.1 hypothetical protein DSp06_gp43 [Dinoroseobacter phage DS-1410Ws-06]ANJ20851.1 hypothetical protein RDp07_gp40 [Roseobacter phage RD-1410Ws-07]